MIGKSTIKILGTSSGEPTIERACSAYIVSKESNKDRILVDCGEGTQLQLLKSGISHSDIKTILISHLHGDHYYGLFGLLKGMKFGSDRTKRLTLIAPKELKGILENTFKHPLMSLIEFIALEDFQDDEVILSSIYDISAIKLKHRTPSWGFIFRTNDISTKLIMEKVKKFPKQSWGLIQNRDYKALKEHYNISISIKEINDLIKPKEKVVFGISGDNAKPEIWGKITDIGTLVHESTYTEVDLLKVGKKPQHSSARMICEFANYSDIKTLVLTHFSKRYYGTKINLIRKEAERHFDKKLIIANDFDEIVI